MLPGLQLHHVGWAVENLDVPAAHFRALGYLPDPTLPDTVDPQFQVALRFLCRSEHEPLIELIAPAGPQSSVTAILKRSGPGPYHLGYRVADLAAAGAQLRAAGFVPITEAVPAPALGQRLIQFWRSSAAGLVELILWPQP